MTKKLSNLIRPILISSSFAIVFVCSAGYSANKPLHAIQCVRLVLPGLDRYSDQIKVHVSETNVITINPLADTQGSGAWTFPRLWPKMT